MLYHRLRTTVCWTFGVALLLASAPAAVAQIGDSIGSGVGIGTGVSIDLETIPEKRGERPGDAAFPAKALCGTILASVVGAPGVFPPFQFPAPNQARLVPGTYLTDLEVVNTGRRAAEIVVSAVETFATGFVPQPPAPTTVTLVLNPGEAVEFDCADFLALAGFANIFDDLRVSFLKGWFIVSTRRFLGEVSVMAVYTLKNVEVLLGTLGPPPVPPPGD